MSDEVKAWWEHDPESYQAQSDIPIGIHYGPGSPFERDLDLLGPLEGTRVIELGCGGAQCSIAFAKRGADVVGVDLSTGQLAFARELVAEHGVTVDLVRSDVTELGVASCRFDLAFSAFVFQWIEELHTVFEEAFRILAPGGRFVFSLPHPFFRTVDPETLELEEPYFERGRTALETEHGPDMVTFTNTLADLVNPLIDAGFVHEEVVEPDSRVRCESDPWYGLWDYQPEALDLLPPTLIVAAGKPT